MKYELEQVLQPLKTSQEKLNRLREFLQALLLKTLDQKGWTSHLIFLGGTALRIVYQVSRYSEDLDFSWIGEKPLDFELLTRQLEKELRLSGFTVTLLKKGDKVVNSCFIKFPGLLYELELSPLKSQNFSIKLEVDTHPPSGYLSEIRTIHQDFFFQTHHHDLSTLCAGKCCAVLSRAYVKGRDYYDLMWLAGKKAIPNYTYLTHALSQVSTHSIPLDRSTLKKMILAKIEKTDFSKVKADVIPFLMRPDESRYLTADSLSKLLLEWLSS